MLFWFLNLFYSKFFNIFNSWKKLHFSFYESYFCGFLCKIFIFCKHWIFVIFYEPSHFAFSKMLLYDHKFHDHILLLFVFYLDYYILLFFPYLVQSYNEYYSLFIYFVKMKVLLKSDYYFRETC